MCWKCKKKPYLCNRNQDEPKPESLKEYDIFELPDDFETDVDEYTDNIMNVIENS